MDKNVLLKTDVKRPSTAFYVVLGAASFAFIETFSLLSPILLSFLVFLLISLAVNPVISRMRALTGGRKVATGLIATALIAVIVLMVLAFIEPMKTSVAALPRIVRSAHSENQTLYDQEKR